MEGIRFRGARDEHEIEPRWMVLPGFTAGSRLSPVSVIPPRITNSLASSTILGYSVCSVYRVFKKESYKRHVNYFDVRASMMIAGSC